MRLSNIRDSTRPWHGENGGGTLIKKIQRLHVDIWQKPAQYCNHLPIKINIFLNSFKKYRESLCAPMDCSPPGSSVHGDFPGMPCLPPGDCPTQESNWGLLHWRRILYQLSYQGRPATNYMSI